MNQSRLGLLQTEILSSLSDDDLSKFKFESVSKASVFYSELPKIFLLKSGSAKLSFLEDGEEFILYNLGAGNLTILNENCVLEFLENSEVYTLYVDDLELILKNEAFMKSYIDTLANIILIQRKIIRSILFENAKGRIANFLIELAKEQNLKQNGYSYVFLPFSLKVLSSFVGLKRQSASTVFNELIKEGTIQRMSPHECVILDYEKLEGYTN